MTKKILRSQKGFTLIELLTVIAIIGILAAIIIPTVAGVQERARRTTDLSNIKQIVQSAIIYANDNNSKFPQLTNRKLDGTAGTENVTPTLWAGLIAKASDLNSPKFYISASDPLAPATLPATILNSNKTALDGAFTSAELSVELVAGLRQSDASTTPIVFTRGLTTGGRWTKEKGVYKDEGGHVAFIGGNVAFYKDTLGDSGTGAFTGINGSSTENVLQALRTTQKVYGTGNAGVGSAAGTSGSGS